MDDTFRRFLFDDLDIRGVHVRLEKSWQQMLHGRNYAANTAQLLGEMTAVTTILGGQLKQPGRLSFQLRSDGPLRTMVIDCDHELRLRGMARAAENAAAASVAEILKQGQLAMFLDLPDLPQPFQSLVPLVGDSIAAVFEHYLEQSEQHATRLILAASETAASGLFLQKLPDADQRDADGWNRILQLAATVTPDELLTLDAEALLQRLFHQETLRVFEARSISYHCPEDWDKVRAMLLSLGQAEVEAILAEHGEVVIFDDICNRHYRFDALTVAELFTGSKPTLH